jgi:hypothetical protein
MAMGSQEKLLGFLDWLFANPPPDEGTRIIMALLKPALPVMLEYLPNEPAELDELLRQAAWAALRCRSDGAPAMGLFDAVETAEGGLLWTEVEP